MARVEADSACFNMPSFQIPTLVIFRASGWHLPGGVAAAAAEPPDVPRSTTVRPAPGANAQPWALG
eukprot:4870967-Pyramimonas_sp.AAC.1